MLYCTPFLLFNGNCADAMTFYQYCFGGELMLTKTGDTPMKDQFSPDKHDKIINAHLKSASIEFSAADWHADNLIPQQGNVFSIFVVGDTYSELKIIFDKLAREADKDKRTFMELHEVPFGIYGQLTDKYHVSWIFRGKKKE